MVMGTDLGTGECNSHGLACDGMYTNLATDWEYSKIAGGEKRSEYKYFIKNITVDNPEQ